MQQNSTTQSVDIRDVYEALRKRKLTIFLPIVISVAATAAFLVTATPLYEASIAVIPVQDEQSGNALSGIARQFGGVASLAGINLQGPSGAVEAMAVLRSRAFAIDFINEQKLVPVIYEDLWDEEADTWIDSNSSENPSILDAYSVFLDDVIQINENTESGVVSITMRWRDPVLAASWANAFVAAANEGLRSRAVKEAASSIEFLEQQALSTDVVGLKQAIYRLMEMRIQDATMAQVREEFAFRVIDPAVVPDLDDPVWPNTMIFLIAALMVGLFVGVFAAIVAELVSVVRSPRGV